MVGREIERVRRMGSVCEMKVASLNVLVFLHADVGGDTMQCTLYYPNQKASSSP